MLDIMSWHVTLHAEARYWQGNHSIKTTKSFSTMSQIRISHSSTCTQLRRKSLPCILMFYKRLFNRQSLRNVISFIYLNTK